MKMILITLLLLLATESNSTNGQRGNLLCSIENKKVSKFINRIYSDAEHVCNKYNLPLSLLLGQCCLESGYGSSRLCKERCNYLGIKYEGRYAEFESRRHCFESWAKVMRQKCYKNLQPSTLIEWYDTLTCCKYAQSKRYIKKLNWIIFRWNLDKII